MVPTTKYEITLSENLSNTIKSGVAEIKALQAEIQSRNEKLVILLNGVYLQHDIDFKKEGVLLSEDFKTVKVYDLPTEDAPQIEVEPVEKIMKKAVKKTIK